MSISQLESLPHPAKTPYSVQLPARSINFRDRDNPGRHRHIHDDGGVAISRTHSHRFDDRSVGSGDRHAMLAHTSRKPDAANDRHTRRGRRPRPVINEQGDVLLGETCSPVEEAAPEES